MILNQRHLLCKFIFLQKRFANGFIQKLMPQAIY
jgi:hypothetical protein